MVDKTDVAKAKAKLTEKAGLKPVKQSSFILDPSESPQRIDHALGKVEINLDRTDKGLLTAQREPRPGLIALRELIEETIHSG